MDAELAASVRTQIATALVAIDAPAEVPPSLGSAVAVLADLWDGTCTIVARLAPYADARLARDPGARAAAFEVIREANLNAIRHGAAQHVTVDVVLDGPSTITVRVTDDGRGWTGTRGRGRGSGIMDELTAGWAHVADAGGTTLTATIRLA
ncbi:MAG: ATP-binding protein [Chloroflexota bacterium]